MTHTLEIHGLAALAWLSEIEYNLTTSDVLFFPTDELWERFYAAIKNMDSVRKLMEKELNVIRSKHLPYLIEMRDIYANYALDFLALMASLKECHCGSCERQWEAFHHNVAQIQAYAKAIEENGK